MSETNQSESIGELAKALSVAQGKMQAVPRNAENPFFKSSYADLSSIIAAARDILAENGLSIVQFGLPTENGKVALATQLNHISGQWVRGIMMAKPVKDDPQAMGSCVTYLRRYGFQAMLGLVQEGEDDDGNQASEGGGKSVKQEPQKKTIPQKHAEVFQAIIEEGGNAPKTPPAASATPGASETPAEKKNRFLALFRSFGDAAREVFIQQNFILPTETIEDIDNIKLDKLSKAQVSALVEEVKQEQARRKQHAPVLSEGDAQLPDDLHDPAHYEVPPTDSEPWRSLIVPFGPHRGTSLGMLEKNKLWYFVCSWAPKSWTGKDGKRREPSAAEVAFYNGLKPHRAAIIKRYNFTIPEKEITP